MALNQVYDIVRKFELAASVVENIEGDESTHAQLVKKHSIGSLVAAVCDVAINENTKTDGMEVELSINEVIQTAIGTAQNVNRLVNRSKTLSFSKSKRNKVRRASSITGTFQSLEDFNMIDNKEKRFKHNKVGRASSITGTFQSLADFNMIDNNEKRFKHNKVRRASSITGTFQSLADFKMIDNNEKRFKPIKEKCANNTLDKNVKMTLFRGTLGKIGRLTLKKQKFIGDGVDIEVKLIEIVSYFNKILY